jgi:dephospho-CoA kinase
MSEFARGPMVALTGGIGCGKSESGRILAGLGAAVSEADEVARALLEPGQEVFEQVRRRFGSAMLDPGGRIDRGRLAALVFADGAARKALNELTHPPVMRAWAQVARAEGRMAVAVVPLLFEAGAHEGWSAVVCVAADEAVALARLRARGLDEEQARRRMAAQWPLARKIERSDYVIWNNGGRERLERETARIYREIMKKERGQHA